MSAELIRGRVDDLPETGREFDILVSAFYAEIRGKLVLYLPGERGRYYERDDVLGERASAAFPTARNELRLAANAYAVGLPTACVFHAMRAAEIGLRALATELECEFNVAIELVQMHPMLEQIEKKIEGRKSLPKSVEKDEGSRFYSEAASQFRYFKDGWRVRVAHARALYDEVQALKVLEHTRDFFETLGERLKEPVSFA